MKQLFVKLENREEKERVVRDQQMRKQIYASGGIEELKKDIETLRIGVASMKSEYNIKIKKIEKQIKEIKEKNSKIQIKENVEALREQLTALQERRDQINENILNQQNLKVTNIHNQN